MPPTLSLSQCLCACSSHILSELSQSSLHISTGHLSCGARWCVRSQRDVCMKTTQVPPLGNTVWWGTQTLIHRNIHPTTGSSRTERRTLSSPYNYQSQSQPFLGVWQAVLKHLTHELVSFLLDPCEVGQSSPHFIIVGGNEPPWR